MNFPELIDSAAAGLWRDHSLTDGRFTCCYGDLPALLEGIDRHFQNQGVDFAETVVLECINTLPAALTLMALLYKGRTFLLLPGGGEASAESSPAPPLCKHRIAVRRAPPDVASDWPMVPEQFLRIIENERYGGRQEEPCGGEARLCLRTSGSMGAGKIVVHSHGRLLRNAQNCLDRFGPEPGDRVALPVPIFHMYGLGAGFLPALAAGASIHLEDNCNILRYLESERRFNPNVAFLNPPLCEMLLRGRRSARPYRRVVTSTQRIREDVFRSFDAKFGGGLLSLYGSTEMGAVAACQPDAPLEQRCTTLGPPMAGVRLRLDGADGAGAELFCLHPHGFLGYLDDEGRWLHRTAPEEWYRTGDVAQADASGHLAVMGRAGNSVNRNGHLVMFGDIEKALEKLAEVAHAAVVATRDEDKHGRGQRLVAFCAPGKTVALDPAQVRAACFDLLPKHAIPDDVIVIDNLPLLASGKLDRQTLTAMAG
jgi:acyl-coenzyme A synthetase/AMP-(fatty) acid ligase